MGKRIIVYQSNYGATEKYAQWLSEIIPGDIMKIKGLSIDSLKDYDTIILGGGIYATGIAGISFLKKTLSGFEG